MQILSFTNVFFSMQASGRELGFKDVFLGLKRLAGSHNQISQTSKEYSGFWKVFWFGFLWIVRGLFGVRSGFVWVPFRVRSGSGRDPSGICSGTVRGACGGSVY